MHVGLAVSRPGIGYGLTAERQSECDITVHLFRSPVVDGFPHVPNARSRSRGVIRLDRMGSESWNVKSSVANTTFPMTVERLAVIIVFELVERTRCLG